MAEVLTTDGLYEAAQGKYRDELKEAMKNLIILVLRKHFQQGV